MKNEAVLNEEVEKQEESVKQIENEKTTDKLKFLKYALWFAFGMTAGMFPESYMINPFAPAAVAVAKEGFARFTFLGACVGTVLSRGITGSVRYILTYIFVLASRAVTAKSFRSFDKTMITALTASLITLISDVLDMITLGVSVLDTILCIADAVICACSVYFFARSLAVPVFKLGMRRISSYDAVCICISAACLICCVGKVEILGFYIFHIPACLLVMFCACFGRTAGGSICGILLGMVLSFGCGAPAIFYMYAAGGLFAGVFAFAGQYALSAVFAVVSCGSAAAFGEGFTLIPFIAECVSSALIFMLIPPSWFSKTEEYLMKSSLRNDGEVNMQVALDLKNAARTVDSISDVVREIGERVTGPMNPELSRTFARIQHNVCADCDRKGICWNECFDSTLKDIKLIAQLRLSGEAVTAERLGSGIGLVCTKIQKLSDEIDADYKQYVSTMDQRLRIEEMRSVVSDQFSSMAQMLYDISALLAEDKLYDENRSRDIMRALKANRITAEVVSYRENSFSRAAVEIVMNEEPNRVNSEKIRKILSSTLKKKFREAEVTVEDFSTVLLFRQKSEYEFSIGIKQIPCGDNKVCGDCAQSFDSQDGCSIAVISDGMGTGKRAATDAAMTSTIMNRLLSSGFTFKSALKLVNSALMIRNADESLSTVDTVCLNPYNAKVTFNKAGAAASYVRHGEKIYRIEKPSLPVGILRNIDYASDEFIARQGDIILMTSDGVKGESDDWIKETLMCWSTDNMQELASHIASLAKAKNGEKFPDDITVIAIKIMKKK